MSSLYACSSIFVFRRWPRLLAAVLAITGALVVGAAAFAQPVHADNTINVTTTADEFDTTGVGAGCSLREAIRSANSDTAFGGCTAGSGADTIIVPAGTYNITINPGPDENAAASGDFDLLTNITIQGAGAANTIIDALNADRVFDIAPFGGCNCTVNLSGITIQKGKAFGSNFNVGGGIFIGNGTTVVIANSTLANNQTTTSTGGAIQNQGTLTLNNVTLQNNTAFALGGAVNNIGALTVNGSTFSGNKAESGGALYLNTDAAINVSISGSTFTNNQTVATAGGVSDDGGAIGIRSDGGVSITGSTFTGNSAVGNGGAIYFNDSATQTAVPTLTMSYNRIVGNTAAAGNGLYRDSGNATAQRNWWGCNTGPSAGPCDLVVGTVSFTPWIVLTHTASPSTINTGQTATLTADFLKNSDGSANTAPNLGALVGTPVSFGNAVLGAISNAQATIQTNGAATATYTAGASPGAGSATATVDSATVTANLTISQQGTTVTSITRAGANPTNASSVSWTVTFGNAVTGLGAGNFNLVANGLSGANITNVSTASGNSWTVTAATGTGTGTLGLNLVNDTGLNYALSGLPFTGEVYTIVAAPVVTTQPTNVTVNAGQQASFSAAASGSPAPTVQWQVSTDNGATFNDISGATSTTLSFAAQASDNGKQFRAVFTNTAGNANSNAATLTVNVPPVVTTQPANQTVSVGQQASFSAAASGSPAPTVQWQVSTDNGATWTDISGATSTTLSFAAQASDSGKQFRAVFSNAGGNTPTNAATLTVVTDTTPPVITPNVAGTLGANGWYVSDVNVTWSVVDNESAVTSQSGCDPQGVTADTAGVTFTCTATSAGGTGSQSVTIKRDATKPTLAPTVSPNPVAVGQPATASPNATDATSGVATQSCAAVDTSSAGSKSVACTATDNAGNTNTANANYTVVNNAPTIAVAPGGNCAADGTAQGSINLTVGSSSGPNGLTLKVVSNSNAQLVPNSGVVFGGSGANRTMTVTAAAKKYGRATLSIGVTDGANTATVPVTVIVGRNDEAVLIGTNKTDLIFGRNGGGWFYGDDGNDLVCGGNGTDWLLGGNGADTLFAGKGNDLLTGNAGADRFSGGPGKDSATDFAPGQGDTQDGSVELFIPGMFSTHSAGNLDAVGPAVNGWLYLPTLQK